MAYVPGDGPTPNDLMIVGERPGVTEAQRGRAFVGDAGEELWSRIWKVLRLTRDAFYVTNLVKTFSTAPPTPAEIRRDEGILQAEILKVRPTLIVTIGYYAARWFLPQFKDTNGDYFHGLCFPYDYGRLTPRRAHVVPVVHASAALRQPDRYQNQLTADLRAVGEVLQGTRSAHRHREPGAVRVGLAGFGKEGQHLGLDTEGSIAAPECVSLTANGKYCACIDVANGRRPQFLKPAITHAKSLRIHHAKHDWQVLHAIGITDLPRVDDTMLMAYLLDLPQSLKVLAYRELGYQMSEYADLVEPLDDALVRATLTAAADRWQMAHDRVTRLATKIETVRAKGKRVTKKAIAARVAKLLAKDASIPALRVVKGVRRMIANVEDSAN